MAQLIDNRIIFRDYEILDTYSAGVELFGFEVKSVKNGNGSLRGAYVKMMSGRPILLNAYIPEYQKNNTPVAYDPYRTRNLLLTEKEIREIESALHEKSLTVVPLEMYNAGRLIKLKIGIARGLKKADKREKIKARDTARDIRRTLKNG